MKLKAGKKTRYKFGKKNVRKKVLITLGTIVTFFCLASMLSIKPAMNMYKEAMAGKDSFLVAQTSLEEQNFAQTAVNMSEANEHFSKASDSFNKIKWIKYIPLIGRQMRAVDHLLVAGTNIASAIEDISLLGEEVIAIVKVEGEEISYNNIGKKKKKEMLAKLHESPEIIQQATEKLDIAITEIEAIPSWGLVGPLKNGIEPVTDNLPLVQEFADKALPFVEVIPSVAGYPEEKTYLFLLQNNTEMRATGGFLGTYGVLKLESADINKFETDNIYNIDGPAEEFLHIPPLEPFAKYVDAKAWYMRDSNWSPDFPISAKKAEEFYHLENGPEMNFDGIIAVTPSLIEDLITLTGDIEVNGDVYTTENFVDKLQHDVEFGFVAEGISDADRKNVIGDMAAILMERLKNLPKSQWADLWSITSENAEEKQMLLYIKDENVQKYVEELHWDGKVKDTEFTGRDFFMVIDSNMAALKTDKVMERNIDYKVNKEGEDLIATLTMNYYNDGTFTNTTTRYRSYTRFYVPYGSELLSSEGFMTNDKLKGGVEVSAEVKQDEELNKTIFEGFVAIEPKAEGQIVLKYKLPEAVKDCLEEGAYKLYAQKQPGTLGHGLNVTIDIGEKLEEPTDLDLNVEIDNNKMQLIGDLTTDKNIIINLK